MPDGTPQSGGTTSDDGALAQAGDLILQSACVAFVGAGVSIPPSEPWIPFVRGLATHCAVQTGVDESPLDVVDRCIEANEGACIAYMRHSLPPYPASMRTAMPMLYRLPFRAILTTNFDPWLYLTARKTDVRAVWIYPDLRFGLYRVPDRGESGVGVDLLYLHGLFHPKSGRDSVRSLVFGRRAFAEAYGEASLLPGLLLDLFTYENVVFIGFDPMEENMARLLRRSIETRRAVARGGRPIPRRFLLHASDPRADREALEREADYLAKLRSHEITPCIYDREDTDWRGLDRLLGSWVGVLHGPTSLPPLPGGLDMNDGAI